MTSKLYLDEKIKDFRGNTIDYPSLIDSIKSFFDDLTLLLKEKNKNNFTLEDISGTANNIINNGKVKELTVRDVIEYAFKYGEVSQDKLFDCYSIFAKMKQSRTIELTTSTEKDILVSVIKSLISDKTPKYWQYPVMIVLPIIQNEIDNTPKETKD